MAIRGVLSRMVEKENKEMKSDDDEMLEIIEKYEKYFNKIAPSGADAQDIIQEVRLRFFQKSAEEPDWWSKIENKGAYVRISGRNAMISLYRITPKNNDSIDIPDSTGAKELSDEGRWARNLENRFDIEVLRQKLKKAMEDFTGEERKLIQLSYFEGCKPRQIAKILGLDYRYVQADCNRARAKFLARIKGILKTFPA
jgi:RNA polymerase sigma factor (sigma-70 family)